MIPLRCAATEFDTFSLAVSRIYIFSKTVPSEDGSNCRRFNIAFTIMIALGSKPYRGFFHELTFGDSGQEQIGCAFTGDL